MEKKKKLNVRTLSENEFFYGHKACGGCGGSLAVRIALKVLGERTVSVLPAGCMSAVAFNYPQLCFANNAMISTFAGTASMMSGVAAGLRAKGEKDYYVVGFAGDGGTADIGIQALSGAIDRGEDILYICYDNEAYMNTGIQKSGLTPYAVSTTTSPAGKFLPGNIKKKKNLFEIIAAHDIDYAATATVGYLQDYITKLEKAKAMKGTRFIHIMAPCPTGWGSESSIMVQQARELADTGLFPLVEYENHQRVLNYKPKAFSSIENYIQQQKRYQHLSEKEIEAIKQIRDHHWQVIEANYQLEKTRSKIR